MTTLPCCHHWKYTHDIASSPHNGCSCFVGLCLTFEAGLKVSQSKTCLGTQVTIRDLDPKSISTQELYGYVNMSTREWKDGLLSYNMRELANLPDDNPKWILLDGDLDANW